ncbi:uroplakin-3a-like [Ambystoma mexicanum]|uniref:uroplakin-3a-like n=1 Tax=Ambystoma mexicanum TaxID=8296 RepID=UPI0037E8E70C
MASAFRLLSWALLATALSDKPPPQLASPMLVANNPTLTTVALQKPVCVFSAAVGGIPLVSLYGVRDSASTTTLGNGTFRTTNGGATGPYGIATFPVPKCTLEAPDPSQPSFLVQYIIRVGDDVTCLNDPNFRGICNPPLSSGTAYRFLYALIGNGAVVDRTLWSDPITTKTMKSTDTLDTWPGRRSGGMIVITSILSVLLFFLLAGFITAVVANVLSGGQPGIETSRHETRTTQQAMPKAQASTEPPYSSVNTVSTERERYAAKPQA